MTFLLIGGTVFVALVVFAAMLAGARKERQQIERGLRE
jgi:hypothetical protein